MDRSMDGKYCIVTGSNGGIGLQVARGLMQRGAHVVMACRNMAACEKVAAELREEGLAGSCTCRPLDLESPSSIHAFARQQAAELSGGGPQEDDGSRGAATGWSHDGRRRNIDVLVNNAGVMGVPPAADGSDRHLTVNHLGPYLLTRLLLPNMTHGSRIVNVASRAHYGGSLSLITGPSGGAEAVRNDTHHWWWQYARSKLCNVLFTAELQRRYGYGSNYASGCSGGGADANTAARGADVSSGVRNSQSTTAGGGIGSPISGGGIGAFAVSPGMVDTGIFRHLLPGWAQWLRAPLRPFVRSPQQGAEVVLFAAVSPELEGREVLFLHDCQEMRPSAAARDAQLAADLWRVSAALVGQPEEGGIGG
ncbi:hypothetical protein PLESTB_000288500 [Pleodorina starrii]|uniref:Uncharacterized protein n=1 Tax=Pleodorina starrii TaxID=330485 RepID=A0A9W6BCW4_9CHLO|nr:hypothetical protein PLESTM_001404500 [Pleodorina starrii]GLC49759.1 hypothetical protein PLESTB_000288500 [Pleodorina starrii]GLC77497.1 hypothetical protein PLESTF_001942200 [Pleodorina starrii]